MAFIKKTIQFLAQTLTVSFLMILFYTICNVGGWIGTEIAILTLPENSEHCRPISGPMRAYEIPNDPEGCGLYVDGISGIVALISIVIYVYLLAKYGDHLKDILIRLKIVSSTKSDSQ